MSDLSSAALSRAFVPLRLADRSLLSQTVAVLLGTAFLALSSWIEVPMFPVPMTMQTFAVLLIGAVFGWRLGALTVLAWLGEAMIGLPVLAGGKIGFAPFVGPTAGYLASFPIAAAFAGWCAERAWTSGPARAFGVMMVGHAFILALGATWLSTLIGVEKAIAAGVVPFLIGSVLKSGLAVASIEAWRRARPNTQA